MSSGWRSSLHQMATLHRLNSPSTWLKARRYPIQRIGGYELSAVARLDAVGFHVSPEDEQSSYLPSRRSYRLAVDLTPRELGQQRLAISLVLRWTPIEAASGLIRESMLYSRRALRYASLPSSVSHEARRLLLASLGWLWAEV